MGAGSMMRAGLRRWFVALALAALAGSTFAADKRVALVIGNAAYEHTTPLLNPGNDAADMAEVLGRLGFEVIEGTDLDVAGFDDKLREFEEAGRGAEVALFFYAGHGLQDVKGRNWLVPVDARLERPRSLKREAIELADVMESMRGDHNLVFLDACRDNPFAGDLARSMGLSRSAGRRGLARVEGSGSGTFIGYATTEGAWAADGKPGDKNSPYTKGLLKYIATPGVSVYDMHANVAAYVHKETGGKQEPWLSGSTLGVFYLASGAPPPPPKDVATAAAGGTSQPPLPSGDAARAYERAKDIGTVAAFLVVKKRFPRSIEAEFAQAEIDKLKEKPLKEKPLKEKPLKEKPPVVAGGDPVEEEAPAVVTPSASSPEEVEDRLELSREERRLVQTGVVVGGT